MTQCAQQAHKHPHCRPHHVLQSQTHRTQNIPTVTPHGHELVDSTPTQAHAPPTREHRCAQQGGEAHRALKLGSVSLSHTWPGAEPPQLWEDKLE